MTGFKHPAVGGRFFLLKLLHDHTEVIPVLRPFQGLCITAASKSNCALQVLFFISRGLAVANDLVFFATDCYD